MRDRREYATAREYVAWEVYCPVCEETIVDVSEGETEEYAKRAAREHNQGVHGE